MSCPGRAVRRAGPPLVAFLLLNAAWELAVWVLAVPAYHLPPPSAIPV